MNSKHFTWTYLVLGLGKTGQSCIAYLNKIGASFAVADSRNDIANLTQIMEQYDLDKSQVFLGDWQLEILAQAQFLVISPGIALSEPAIEQALNNGSTVCSDIELFFDATQSPIVAVTGSNGKSTVVSLLGEITQAAELNYAVAGNIGLPVLDLLDVNGDEDTSFDGYILELSSFQLERLSNENNRTIDCACVLNVSEDHMDRYPSFQAYVDAKHKVFENAKTIVINLDDENTHSQTSTAKQLSFSLNNESQADFYLSKRSSDYHLQALDIDVLTVDQVALKGRHNIANVLASLAIVEAMSWPKSAADKAIREFSGLPHRCQFVSEYRGILYINDSKATNVGSTLAAIDGLCALDDKRVVLIAGGVGKGADFSTLVEPVKHYARSVVLLGEAAEELESLFADYVSCQQVSDMNQAVAVASEYAQTGDYVLLSPACASLDMYKNFEQRGEHFVEAISSYMQNNQQDEVQHV